MLELRMSDTQMSPTFPRDARPSSDMVPPHPGLGALARTFPDNTPTKQWGQAHVAVAAHQESLTSWKFKLNHLFDWPLRRAFACVHKWLRVSTRPENVPQNEQGHAAT